MVRGAKAVWSNLVPSCASNHIVSLHIKEEGRIGRICREENTSQGTHPAHRQ